MIVSDTVLFFPFIQQFWKKKERKTINEKPETLFTEKIVFKNEWMKEPRWDKNQQNFFS